MINFPANSVALNSWLFQGDMVGIQGPETASYPTGTNVGFRPGRLIQNQSQLLYFVTNETDFPKARKRHVLDQTTQNCIFPGEADIDVTNADALQHLTGTALQVSGTGC